jgi:hypothetical protein
MAATGAKTIGVYFDTVETAQSQASATATYADDTHTDAITGTGVNAVAYAVTTAATGSTVRETASYVVAPVLNALYGYSALGTGEGLKITYGGVNETWGQATADGALATVDALVTAINADTTFGNGIDITAAKDSYATSYNKISYTDSAGGAETTATTGTVLWSLGTVTGTFDIGLTSTTAQIATAMAAAVSGTVVSGVGYQASAATNAVVMTRLITNTSRIDRGPNTSDFPDLAFILGNATFTTVDFSANAATTNSTGVSSDFFLSIAQTNVNGLRVTIKNNSTAVALSATITNVASVAALAVPTALVSGTNMTPNAAYVSAFADISDATAASTATKNRISWLG